MSFICKDVKCSFTVDEKSVFVDEKTTCNDQVCRPEPRLYPDSKTAGPNNPSTVRCLCNGPVPSRTDFHQKIIFVKLEYCYRETTNFESGHGPQNLLR